MGAPHPASAFAEIAIGTTNDAVETTVLSQRHVGWLYATTRTLQADPYAALPADFQQEVEQLILINATR